MRPLVMVLRAVGGAALLVLIAAWLYPAPLERWLAARSTPTAQSAPRMVPTPTRAPAADEPPPVAPTGASPAQAAMAHWLGSKYRTAPYVLETLIVEADKLAQRYRLSPNLLIAVMAIESNFHPYIQSEAGAQGMMQVMPRIHARRYEKYGGAGSFIDPMVSLRVGAEILRDCVKLKGGSETEGLRFYFGGGAASDGYIDKVRAEQQKLDRVAAGLAVAVE